MQKTNYIWLVTNALITLFLFFRIGVPYLNSSDNILAHTESLGLFFAHQANQFALLQVILSIFGMMLAIAGFWGYVEIKKVASQKADDTVKEEVPKLFQEMLQKFSKDELQKMLVEAQMHMSELQEPEQVLDLDKEQIFEDPMDVRRPYE